MQLTGGQPLLTYQLCHLVRTQVLTLADPQSFDLNTIPDIVQKHMPDACHFQRVRDRLLHNDQQASQLLGHYQHILRNGTLKADGSKDEMDLRLSGLVVKINGTLTVYNPIYQSIFDQTWVQTTLDNLRPYASALNAWVESDRQDDSRLLRGQALEEALTWASERQLSSQDAEFIRVSQQHENQDTKAAVQVLTKANKTAKQRVWIASGLLGVAIALATGLGVWSNQRLEQSRTAIDLEQDTRNALEFFEVNQTQSLLLAMRTAYTLKQECMQTDKESAEPSSNCRKKYSTSVPILGLQEILDKIQLRIFDPNTFDYLWSSHAMQPPIYDLKSDRLLKVDSKIEYNVFGKGKFRGNIFNIFDSRGTLTKTFSRKRSSYFFDLVPGSKQILSIESNTRKEARNGKPFDSLILDEHGEVVASLWTRQRPINIQDIIYTPFGIPYIITIKKDFIKGWNLQSGKSLKIPLIQEDLQGQSINYANSGRHAIMKFTPEEDKLFVYHLYVNLDSWSNVPELWDVESNKRLITFNDDSGQILFADLSPDGTQVVTSNSNGLAKLWNQKGELLQTFDHQDFPTTFLHEVRFSPDGTLIATPGGLWHTAGDNLIRFPRKYVEAIFRCLCQ